MNKINAVGMKLIQYRDEFGKNYPEIVRESMLIALKQMIENGEMDQDAYGLVVNSNHSRKMFLDYLLARKEFHKSPEELKVEYEKLRVELSEIIELHKIDDVDTEISIEKDALLVVKTFAVDESFVMDYFGVGEKELLKLMKKGGFVEVFVSLRLSRVLSYIIEDCSPSMSYIKLQYSLPYLSKSGDGYNIDLLMEINVNDFEQTDWHGKIIGEIKEVSERSGTVFFHKMII